MDLEYRIVFELHRYWLEAKNLSLTARRMTK
jgi:hypothetical protein